MVSARYVCTYGQTVLTTATTIRHITAEDTQSSQQSIWIRAQ